MFLILQNELSLNYSKFFCITEGKVRRIRYATLSHGAHILLWSPLAGDRLLHRSSQWVRCLNQAYPKFKFPRFDPMYSFTAEWTMVVKKFGEFSSRNIPCLRRGSNQQPYVCESAFVTTTPSVPLEFRKYENYGKSTKFRKCAKYPK